MSIRAIVSALTPPLIREGVRRIIHRDLYRELAKKRRTYPSWDAAAAAAGTYDDDLVNRFRAERARLAPSISLLDNSLNWLVRFLPAPLHIVDFGGATGSIGDALRASGQALTYTVVENPTLVRIMAGRSETAYTGSIPHTCDVFFTSGTLQCIGAPYDALEQGFASAKFAVVLKRNNFCDADVYRVHYTPLFDNGAGPLPPGFADGLISYPFRTVRESQVLTIAARHGFDLIVRIPETGDGIVVENEGVYGAQLVFLKQGLHEAQFG